MSNVKRNLKDSIFTFLFRQPEYTRQLYLALHPEDTGVTEADCKLVILESVLPNGQYNDLCLQVNDRILLLVQAKNLFSENITLRMLLYLSETYKRHINENKLDLYSTKAVKIPKPELYVVFTGDRENAPETLSLSSLYGGGGCAEIKVTVRRDTGSSDILDQYVRFCRIADEQREKHGRSQLAIEETIRICTEQGVLAEFLRARKKEVQDIMVTLFDQEKVMEFHDYNLAKEARAEGYAEGRAEVRAEEKGANICTMVEIMRSLSVSREKSICALVENWELSPQEAEERVARYWEN